MAEAIIALVAGLVGAVVGLGGTMLTSSHQRRLEREKWVRQELTDRIGAFLGEINEVWRSQHSGGPPLAGADGPWVACANAYDRAGMVVTDPATLSLLDQLWVAALEIRWNDAGDEIWDEKIWPLMHSLKAQVRESIQAGDEAAGTYKAWQPPPFRSERTRRQ